MKVKSKIEVDVSIITANYNNGRYLKDFFQSILFSTVHPKEIIIIDDGSKDNSLEVISYWSNKLPIKARFFKSNKGLSVALNAALEIAKSKYIMRLDPDDYIGQSKIELQYEYMETHPEIEVLGTNANYFHDQLQKVVFKTSMPLEPSNIEKAYKAGWNGLLPSSVMIRKVLYPGFNYLQDAWPAVDYYLFSKMIFEGVKMKNLPEHLLYYRIHNKNNSQKHLKKIIYKTLEICERIFSSKSWFLKKWLLYKHVFWYRKALSSTNYIKRIICLGIASCFQPKKLINRLFR